MAIIREVLPRRLESASYVGPLSVHRVIWLPRATEMAWRQRKTAPICQKRGEECPRQLSLLLAVSPSLFFSLSPSLSMSLSFSLCFHLSCLEHVQYVHSTVLSFILSGTSSFGLLTAIGEKAAIDNCRFPATSVESASRIAAASITTYYYIITTFYYYLLLPTTTYYQVLPPTTTYYLLPTTTY